MIGHEQPTYLEQCENRIAELTTLNAELLAMLERLQYTQLPFNRYVPAWCPVCLCRGQHAPDCELAALLKKARGE